MAEVASQVKLHSLVVSQNIIYLLLPFMKFINWCDPFCAIFYAFVANLYISYYTCTKI